MHLNYSWILIIIICFQKGACEVKAPTKCKNSSTSSVNETFKTLRSKKIKTLNIVKGKDEEKLVEEITKVVNNFLSCGCIEKLKTASGNISLVAINKCLSTEIKLKFPAKTIKEVAQSSLNALP